MSISNDRYHWYVSADFPEPREGFKPWQPVGTGSWCSNLDDANDVAGTYAARGYLNITITDSNA